MAARKSMSRKASSPRKRKGVTRSRVRKSARPDAPDAIQLLKSDHREVEALFEQFKKTKALDRKKTIVGKICDALTVHATIEEEIFYPQAREALKRSGRKLLDEAEVEHQGIKWKVKELKDADPGNDLYDAKVTVLEEYVRHHVKEEERDMFLRVRSTRLDTAAIGEQLANRKEALTGKPVKLEPTLIERGVQALIGRQ